MDQLCDHNVKTHKDYYADTELKIISIAVKIVVVKYGGRMKLGCLADVVTYIDTPAFS